MSMAVTVVLGGLIRHLSHVTMYRESHHEKLKGTEPAVDYCWAAAGPIIHGKQLTAEISTSWLSEVRIHTFNRPKQDLLQSMGTSWENSFAV